jgi:glycogen(starch) synthase
LRYSLVAHFHEWLGSTAIPELRRAGLPLSIVFTTHATILGRYLAHQDPWFYDHLPFVEWLKDARRLDIEPQVRLERAAAHGAHVLTTVGEPTAEECKHLLGREVDLLTPNGLNIKRYEVMHEFQNLHREYKEKIHQFVTAHFFPNYTFDLDRTLLFFTAGRYEYRNKGYDLTLEALARLNAMLQAEGVDRTVVFFLITRRPYRSILPDVLRRRAMLEEIRRNCEAIQAEFGQRLFEATAKREDPDYNTLVDDYGKLRLQRLMHAWSARSLPTVVTHELLDDAEDDVLKQLRYLNLVNRPQDRVKVVYHPEFVSATDLLFGMDYDHFVRGCHLGIFPSFYEPWGYTPLECVARGIPTVTSDLSGFGSHLLRAAPDSNWRGVLVVGRRNKSFEDSAGQLADALLRFCRQERRERIELRNTVEGYARRFDWKILGEHYADAHTLARQRSGN